MAESSERLFRRERKRRVDASVQLASMNNDLAQPACRIQSQIGSLPDTNSSGRALHQVEGTRQNEQTVAHAPELCGDSAVFVSDDVLHVVYQDVVGPVSSPISGGSRDNSIYLPPLQRRRHSSDVQSADYDHISGAITSDDEESNVNFRQRLQAWAVESRCSHAAVTSLLSVLRSHTCFVSLPSTARTLLQTPGRVLNIRELAGGKFRHFGLEAGLRQTLLDCTHLPDELSLCFSIDGLPLVPSKRPSPAISTVSFTVFILPARVNTCIIIKAFH